MTLAEDIVAFHNAVMQFASKDYIVLQQAIVEQMGTFEARPPKPEIAPNVEQTDASKHRRTRDLSTSSASRVLTDREQEVTRVRRDLFDAWEVQVVGGSLLSDPKRLDDILTHDQKSVMSDLLEYAMGNPTVSMRDLVPSFVASPHPRGGQRQTVLSALGQITRSRCKKTFKDDVALRIWDAVCRMRGDDPNVEDEDEDESQSSGTADE